MPASVVTSVTLMTAPWSSIVPSGMFWEMTLCVSGLVIELEVEMNSHMPARISLASRYVK